MSITVTGPRLGLHHCSSEETKDLRKLHSDFVYCGMLLTEEGTVLSGLGTEASRDGILATVSGYRIQYDKLCLVTPFKSKYMPKVGDFVIGRIINVQNAFWRVEVNCRLSAILRLNNINLPSGELRRKCLQDVISMNEHLAVGDLITAEVQRVATKGQVELHTRNLGHGKLGQGILIGVFPSLIKPQAKHVHEMFGIEVTIGDNGLVWISPEISATGGYGEDTTAVVSKEKRETMVRVAVCVRLLAKGFIFVSDKTILAALKLSMAFRIKDLACSEIIQLFISELRQLSLVEDVS
ncbi:hypothetical protein RB195_009462 [Necator americanus]|uniref:S1 motif domain-containing protein n=1 Tax=Necator americanus TaxID=51031 RepID=A0ABR1CU73_NECAM